MKVLAFFKKEIVLTIALVLAIVSAFFVPPDRAYLDYIDLHTLAVLFCLMAVMAGLQNCGMFQFVAQNLLKKVRQIRLAAFILVMLCFFSSMLITNDVALITFVPFTFIVLGMIGAEDLMVPVVVMQTVAANLGSMLTPIGNPQNLYLYGKAGLGLGEFMLLVLPYAAVSFALLCVWCVVFRTKGQSKVSYVPESNVPLGKHKVPICVYLLLFVLSLLAVAHILPDYVVLLVTVLAVLLMDRKVLLRVDYSLLLTFVGFFIFIGNMGRIEAFNQFLSNIIGGREVPTAVVCSQVMSNVPAALLLSGFTDRCDLLIVGTNLGGLGTLIASMASLISFKYVGKEYKHLRGKYFVHFTVTNVVFLAILLAMWIIIK